MTIIYHRVSLAGPCSRRVWELVLREAARLKHSERVDLVSAGLLFSHSPDCVTKTIMEAWYRTDTGDIMFMFLLPTFRDRPTRGLRDLCRKNKVAYAHTRSKSSYYTSADSTLRICNSHTGWKEQDPTGISLATLENFYVTE